LHGEKLEISLRVSICKTDITNKVISKNVKILFTLVRAMYLVRNMTLSGAAKYGPLGRMHRSTSKAVKLPQLATKFLRQTTAVSYGH
jgi:hypothetical protein